METFSRSVIETSSRLREDELTYQSPDGRYRIRYKLLGNHTLVSESEGYLELESARRGLEIFEHIVSQQKATGSFEPFYYVADTSKLTGMDWKSRQFLVTRISRLFDQHLIAGGALVGSDFLTRTLANLILLFSQRATVKFYTTQATALANFPKTATRTAVHPVAPSGIASPVTAPQLTEAAFQYHESWRNADFIYVHGQRLPIEHYPDWSNDSPDGSYQFRAFLINRNIVLLKESGYVEASYVERGYDILGKIIEYSGHRKLLAINDFSEVKVMTVEARKVVQTRNADVVHYWEHGYLIFSQWTKVMYRLYRLLRPKDAANTTLCDTLEEAFIRCLKFADYKKSASPNLFPRLHQGVDLTKLSQAELLQVASQLQEENLQLKNHQQERIDELFKTIGRITWDDSFKPDYQNVPENDPFYLLYTSISLLQHDVHEMVGKLKRLNRKLEKKVEKRTQKIVAKELNLRSVLENNDIAIALVSKNCELIDYNSLMADLMLHTWGIELQRQWNIEGFISRSAYYELWKERFNEVIDGQVGTYQHTITVAEREHVCEIKLFPIRQEADVVGMSIFVKDITESVMTERKLLAQNEELKKLNSELDRFVYSSAHDLRAPLTSMLGIINILKVETSTGHLDIASTQNYLNLMDRCIQKMDSFIRDIVNFSKNSRLDVVSEPIDFRELCESIFESLHYMDSSRNIDKQVFMEGEGGFNSDYRRLNVVFNNLISNAIRYSHSYRTDPFVHIYINCTPERAFIEVRDNGQGIPEEHQGRIFDMFYRASTSSSGSGLGLYIVKESIAKLKGTIRVESQLDQGTSFHIELPGI